MKNLESSKSGLSEKQVGRVLDGMGVTSALKTLLFAATLGYLFDAFDNGILGYIMPLISKEFNIDPVVKGWIFSTALWGGVLGQYFWGPLADAKGRRVAFQGTILTFAAFTGLAALAWGSLSLGITRFIAGTGLAGFIPVDTSMVSEMSPTKYRGRFSSFIPVVFPLGSLLAAGLSLLLLSKIGWRGMFLLGIIPALIAFWVRRAVPESPRWLASKGRSEEAIQSLKKLGATDEMIKKAQEVADEDQVVHSNDSTGARLTELFSRKWLRSNILAWTLWISVNFAYFGVLLWLPSILVDVYHLSIAKSLTMTVIVNCVGLCGRLFGVYLIDKIGRKPLIIYTYIMSAVFCIALGNLVNPAFLLVLAASFFFFADQSSVCVIAYIPELFPTRLRVLGNSWAAAAGRIASAMAPIMAGALMKFNHYSTIWTIFALVYVVGAIVVWTLGPETKGRVLEELMGESK